MKHNFKKVVSMMLSIVTIVFALAATGYAEPTGKTGDSSGSEITPYFIAITTCGNDLDISGGIASCYGFTHTRGNYIARVVVELQKYENSTWSTIKTWAANGSADYVEIDKDYAIASGTYRVKTTHQALQGIDVVETHIEYAY